MIKRRTIKSVIFLDLKDNREQSGYVFSALIILSYVLVVLTFPLSLCFCLKVCILTNKKNNDLILFNVKFKVVQEYERAVIFRLGRILASGARGKSDV
jgi:erythrocyte band 7 integral membrane protein